MRKTHLCAVALVAGTLYLAGCSSTDPGSSPTAERSPSAPRLATAADLTESERMWGVAPRRTPDVTYQPDVILLDEGPEAIRGVSANGLEWTIDPDASHAAEIQPGRILFATGRVVGRVLGVRKQAGGLAVVLGPIQLTDVVRDMRVSIDTPIDISNALVYTAPQFPGASTPATPLTARWNADDGRPGPRVLLAADTEIKMGEFNAVPSVSLNGISGQVTSVVEGQKFVGRSTLRLATPRLEFLLDIAGGKVLRAELVLSGAAGLQMQMDAAANYGLKNNVARTLHLPTDFSIPLLGPAVPLSVVIRQSFLVKTNFQTTGALHGQGEYTLGGSFRVGYNNGSWGVGGPSGFSAKQDLLHSISGVSQQPSMLTLSHQTRVIVGVGAFGFVTGPFLSTTTSVAVARHSDLDTLVRCRSSSVGVFLAAGVGYFMPRVLTDGINAVLRALNLGQIAGEGGFESESVEVVNHHSYTPDHRLCRGE